MTTTTPRHSDEDQAHPSVRLEAAGSSPEEAMATLPGIYGGRHWHSRATVGPYSYRYLAIGDETLTLRRSQLHGFIRGQVRIGGDYVVYWLTAGSVVLDTLGDPIPLPPLQPRLSPEGEQFVFESTDYDARLVHLDRGLVHDVASERAGLVLEALRFDARTPPGPASVEQWRRAMAATTSVVTDREAAPLAWHEATRAAAAAFLAMYPPLGETLHPALLLPRSARVRAAVEFIHAHAAAPLTVAQIAEAAGLSIRSTQEGFQRVLGVTPMTYLHHLRMDRVHAELVAADPAVHTVRETARRWGFVHLGRFSGNYRKRFGEPPNATLHR